MSRKCLSCGNEVSEQAVFCPKCGKKITVENVAVNQQGYNTQQTYGEQQVYGNQPTSNINPAYLNPAMHGGMMPQMKRPVKKGMQWWHILLIVLGVLFGVVLVGSVLITVVGIISESVESDKAPYSEGEIVNGWYVNEWADIQFEITEEWPAADESVYKGYENEVTDCGFVSQNIISGSQLALLYEEVNGQIINVTEEKYLMICKENISKELDELGLNYEIGEAFEIKIAGETYKALKIDYASGMLYQYICVRKIDEYMVSIIVSSMDETEIQSVLSDIRAMN